MQFNQTEIKDLTAVITLTVEPADYQEAVQKELINIRKKANIPGFRPGMAPKGMLQKMYGKSILAEVINKVIGEGLNKYIEENNLNLLGDPLPNEELTPQMDLDTQDTFVFAFDIAVAPEFDALLNGKNKITNYTITVTDEMVDNQVKSYAQRFGEYVQAEVVEEGDVVKGLLTEQKENGIVKENGMLTPAYMSDKKQAKLFAGAKVGDVITFNPTKAYSNSVEVSSMLGISKEEAEALTSDFTFELQGIPISIPDVQNQRQIQLMRQFDLPDEPFLLRLFIHLFRGHGIVQTGFADGENGMGRSSRAQLSQRLRRQLGAMLGMDAQRTV